MTNPHRAVRPLLLSRDELASCWRALPLGEPPCLLRLTGPPGLTVAESRRHADAVLAAMAERGLTDGNRPVPALAELLALLARPDYRLDIRFPGPHGRPILGLGAVAGTRGLVVVGAEAFGPLELLALDSAQVCATLLGLVGDIRPARGTPVNIPADLVDAAVAATEEHSIWSLAEQLQARGVSLSESSSLARMCSGITFGAKLGASAVRHGSERRGDWVIGFQRTDTGYAMNVRRHNTITVCPTDAARLTRHWHELVQATLVSGCAQRPHSVC